MPTNRRPLRRPAKQTFSPAVIDAWHKGDLWKLHDALGLAPWEFSPLPEEFGAYGLPFDQPPNDGLAMHESWQKVKALQIRLYEVAGEPALRNRTAAADTQ